jgi:hypothetical protein
VFGNISLRKERKAEQAVDLLREKEEGRGEEKGKKQRKGEG